LLVKERPGRAGLRQTNKYIGAPGAVNSRRSRYRTPAPVFGGHKKAAAKLERARSLPGGSFLSTAPTRDPTTTPEWSSGAVSGQRDPRQFALPDLHYIDTAGTQLERSIHDPLTVDAHRALVDHPVSG